MDPPAPHAKELFPCFFSHGELEYFREKIESGYLTWNKLPEDLERDESFARSLQNFPAKSELVGKIFEQFPSMRLDLDIWQRCIINSTKISGQTLFRLVRNYAPASVTTNHRLMLAACQRSCEILQLVDDVSFGRTFLTALLQNAPYGLAFMSAAAQTHFPDLVVPTFALLNRMDRLRFTQKLRSVAANIVPFIWEDRSALLSWFRAGLPFLTNPVISRQNFPEHHIAFTQAWKDDPEICLLIARYENSPQSSFEFAAPFLRRNKDFMLQVLEIQPMLLRSIPRLAPMRQDFDILLQAFGRSRAAIEHYLKVGSPTLSETAQNVASFQAGVQELLQVHESFTKTVLLGMSAASTESILSRLDQGAETSLSHKKILAEYLNVPTGKKLRLLRQARTNVMDWKQQIVLSPTFAT